MYNGVNPIKIHKYQGPYKNGNVGQKEEDENSSSNSQTKLAIAEKQSEQRHNINANTSSKLRNSVNISQIITDFKNTRLAIGTPDTISQEIDTYLHLIETEANKDNPNKNIIKTNLKNASKILDGYIGKELNKPSKVVEGWVDALFLQNVNYKANPNDINPAYQLNLPNNKHNSDRIPSNTNPINTSDINHSRQHNLSNTNNNIPTENNFVNNSFSMPHPSKLNKMTKEESQSYFQQQLQNNSNYQSSPIRNNIQHNSNIVTSTIPSNGQNNEPILQNYEINHNINTQTISNNQNIEFNNNNNNTLNQTQIEYQNIIANNSDYIQESNIPVENITTTSQPLKLQSRNKVYVPKEEHLKNLFIQGKKLSKNKDYKNSLETFKEALIYAKEKNDTQTQALVHLELGKLFDKTDYLPQAIKSFNNAAKKSNDYNVKALAHLSMGKIYDELIYDDASIDHYIAAVSYAGETDNIKLQTTALSNLGELYSQKYDENKSITFFNIAKDYALESNDDKTIGRTYKRSAESLANFKKDKLALNDIKTSTIHYANVDNSEKKVIENYKLASQYMLNLGNKSKAIKLLEKAQNMAKEINAEDLSRSISKSLVTLKRN